MVLRAKGGSTYALVYFATAGQAALARREMEGRVPFVIEQSDRSYEPRGQWAVKWRPHRTVIDFRTSRNQATGLV